MVYADLHVHTTRSDGEMSLSDVPAAAREAGVSVAAITDHDRIHPDLDAPVTQHEGVTLIRGIELRVETGDQRVDLLGYGVSPTPALEDELDRLQRDRIERGRSIVENIEDRIGVELDVDISEGIGRPHIARAVDEHPDADYDYEDAFSELIGSDCDCFVARDVTPFDRGRDLLSAACDLVSLAHPLRYPNPNEALALTEYLDGVERFYPYGDAVDVRPVERAIAEHDLVGTGGSDAHDDTLGVAGLSESEFHAIRGRFS
ncbi:MULTISPECIES: PHP domain-containing protein [Halostella]|uniref:PHP domain-containing protein n=1 Tax=Halostella TaxID=1843185 RepID=UPI0010807E6F|nr:MULTISPECIES: PHP domain-containing protein [Halostella]